MQKKRLVSVLLAGALIFGSAVQVKADDLQDAQNQASELQEKKEAAQAEKDSLAAQLEKIVDDMEKTKSDIEKKQEEIAGKTDELIAAQIDENNQYNSMKLRIQFMYENGNSQFLETLLESKSIAEFLSNAEYIAQISEYDRNMLVEFQEIVTSVEEQKKELEEENKELEKMQASLQEQQTEMEDLIENKSEEISSLSAELGEVNEKIAALKEEAERQARMQREAQQAANNANTTNPGGTTVTPTPPYTGGGSGRLQNPCPAAYISSEFGGRTSPGGIGSTNHKGRDYAAGSGTPIYAAASGTVTQVGYNSARGKYVIVNHGDLATLYQHCDSILVSTGQSVSTGQNIATVGNTGASTGPHLHFEVWVNGTPVDPRLYL